VTINSLADIGMVASLLINVRYLLVHPELAPVLSLDDRILD
jgi:hypothetical protein